MILTEEEAKTKWCPHVRAIMNNWNVATNTRETERNAYDARCIASECMSWRWDHQYESMTEEGHGGDIVLRLKRKKGEPKRGYCGLAGKPND